jgi:hypothetical protein
MEALIVGFIWIYWAIKWKNRKAGFNFEFWHRHCYTDVSAVATGNEVDKPVIIITRRSRCSRRIKKESKQK